MLFPTTTKNYIPNVEFDNIKPYEHRDTIPLGTPTENYKDIVLHLFWHHLNMNLGEDELPIVENLLMVLIIEKYL